MEYIIQLKKLGFCVKDGQSSYCHKGKIQRSYICAYTTLDVCKVLVPKLKRYGMCHVLQTVDSSSVHPPRRVNVAMKAGEVYRYLHPTNELLDFPIDGADAYIVIWNKHWPSILVSTCQRLHVAQKLILILQNKPVTLFERARAYLKSI